MCFVAKTPRAFSYFLILAFVPFSAQALTMNASLQFGSSILNGSAANQVDSLSTQIGVDLTMDLGTYVEAGVFFTNNFVSYSEGTRGDLRFYGALLRIGLLGHGSNLYADTQLGISQRSGGPFTSEHGIGLGAGLGYRIWLLPYMDLSPRVGFRILPEPFQGTSTSNTTVDGTLLLSFGF